MSLQAAIKDIKKLHGIAPFDVISNISRNCGHFASSLEKKYPESILIKARAVVLGSKQESTTSGRTQAKKPNKTNTPKEEKMSESIQDELANFIGKELPKDPNLRLLAWHELQALQKKLRVIEMDLRKEMTAHFFDVATAKEGTNTADIGNGWKVRYKHGLDRKCDEAAFEAVFAKLPEGSKETLIKFKPEVNIKGYRALPEESRKIFEECLIIKPSSPALELVAPKES